MIESLVLAAVVLASSQQPSRDVDCRPAVLERSSPTRRVIENYYDQGRDSIAALHPRHRLLAERRGGLIGRLEYSLLAYQPEAQVPVSIAAIGVDWQNRRVWSIESSCVIDAWAGGLIDTLAALDRLGGSTRASADTALIEAVRSTVAREIDPLLPTVSFEAWLARVLESRDGMQWEVNDCGEQTGNPASDRGRDFPKCVQLRVELTARRALILMLSAGSQQKPPAGAPDYHSGVLIHQDGRSVEVRRLTDLSPAIQSK